MSSRVKRKRCVSDDNHTDGVSYQTVLICAITLLLHLCFSQSTVPTATWMHVPSFCMSSYRSWSHLRQITGLQLSNLNPSNSEDVKLFIYSVLPDFRNSIVLFWRFAGLSFCCEQQVDMCRGMGGMLPTEEDRTTGRETCHRATLCTTNLTRTRLKSNRGIRDERPAGCLPTEPRHSPFEYERWPELHIKIQSVPRSKHTPSVTKTNQSMLYGEIIAVCSQIHTKHINTLCGQNVECRTYRAVNTPSQL